MPLTARRLALYWGVVPVVHGHRRSALTLSGMVIGRQLVAHGLVGAGAAVVFININPDLTRPDANYLRIQRSVMSLVHYTTIGAVALAFLLAALAVRIARALVLRCSDTLDIVSAENRAAVDARAQQLIRATDAAGLRRGGGGQHLVRPVAARRGRAAVESASAVALVARSRRQHHHHPRRRLGGDPGGEPRHRAPAVQARRPPLPGRSRMAAARRDAERRPDEHGHGVGGVRRHPDAAAGAVDRRHADSDRRRHRRPRDRLRRAESGAGRHFRVSSSSSRIRSGSATSPASTASAARSSRSTCGRSCCATAKEPCRCFPTAR